MSCVCGGGVPEAEKGGQLEAFPAVGVEDGGRGHE